MAQNFSKKISTLNIWDHQKDAVIKILEYIKSNNVKSYLVKMPTGTGKTGVFASLTRIARPDLNYLIITPSSALKFQIIEELENRFWNKIGHDVSKLEDQIIESLMPSNFQRIMTNISGRKFIIVTTIQALQSIASDQKKEKEYKAFQSLVNCIVFDEGHKEPAYTWGETVRSFNKPTILFSATPYRNDYKVFNIDKENFFSIEHQFSTDQNFLRPLKILDIDEKPFTIPTFLTKLLSEIYKLEPELKKQGIDKPKTIIRCESSDDIKKIVNALLKNKKRAIGIHENFSQTRNFSKQIPTISDQDKFEFFVHQYKLIEGIDNPDFCIVAIYSDFKSTRLLIQQIGRVLRNPLKTRNQIAYLFCRNLKKTTEEWTKYLEYDKLLDERGKLFDITDILKVNKDVSTLYFSGTFRDLVNVNNIDLKSSILFQKKINVFIQDGTLSFPDLCNFLVEEWEGRDYHILKVQNVSPDTFLILYIKYENSPLVKEGVFIEQTLAVTFIKTKGNHIYYYDSIQSSPMRQLENLKPIGRDFLARLFKDKRSVNKVFLMNTDIGANNVRNKELQAGAIEYTAPGLSDYSYFPARIEGNVISNGVFSKRYVGFQNGRITDFTNTRIEFDEFDEWLDLIHQEVLTKTSNNKLDGFMNRFSEKVDAPLNPIATSILLDLDNEILYRYGFGDDKVDLYINDYCAIIENGEFTIEINNEKFDFQINYDTKFERFIISSLDINERIINIDNDDPSLLTYLNTNQSFRLVLLGNEYVYAHKNFFKPSINITTKKQNLDINQLFKPFSAISKISSEKGNSKLKVVSNSWHKDTLFGLIARQGKGYNDSELAKQFGFDYLLCDDLGSEIADFIGLDTIKKRVVFIHGKAKKSKLSASNFTEICGQATKNLDYLTPYYQRVPKQNTTKWKEPWELINIGKVANRIVTNNATSNQFWDKYVELISNPTTSREVWMIVGNMFDYHAFQKEIRKKDVSKIKSEVIQLIYLIRSTWNSVSQVGAQLKIFC